MTTWRLAAAAVVLVLLGSACGTGRRSAPEPVSYGTPTSTAAETTAPPTPADTAGRAPAPIDAGEQEVEAAAAGPANVSTRVDDAGLELELTVGSNTRFARDENILLQLRFRNVSSEPIRYDSNQKLRFAMFTAGASDEDQEWDNTRCAGVDDQQQVMTGPLTLQPGEEGVFQDRYPVDRAADSTTAGADRDACVLPAGAYAVIGQVDWCPESSLRTSEHNGQPYCDRSGVVPLASAPVSITLE